MRKWILAIAGSIFVLVVVVAVVIVLKETSPEQKIEQRIQRIQKIKSSIVFLPPSEKMGQWNDEKLGLVQLIVKAGRMSHLLPKRERPVLEEIFLPNDSHAPEWWRNDNFSKTAVLVVGRGIVLREEYFSFQFTLILPGISVADIANSSCREKEEIAERIADSFLSASRQQNP